ncbi:exodeoxyribonuclease III, partial [Streptococcus sobrinus]
MKLISWNIDSLNAALTSDSARALLSRQVIASLVDQDADIIAIQETKLSAKGPTKKHLALLEDYFPDYQIAWRSSVEPARKGYAGTMFLYKSNLPEPNITYPEIDAPSTMDDEGRIITLEFDKFFVTQVYTPNAGDGLRRLEERQIWDQKYADYLVGLDQQKPVLASGDYNVAHKEIDLANPSSNRRSPGFTDEERQGFTNLLDKGFT